MFYANARQQKIINSILSFIGLCGVIYFAHLYAFWPCGQAVSVDGKSTPSVKLYVRPLDRDLLIVEPSSLGGLMYIVYKDADSGDADAEQAEKVSSGVVGFFGNIFYCTAYVDPSSLSELDNDDVDKDGIIAVGSGLTFKDYNGHEISVTP